MKFWQKNKMNLPLIHCRNRNHTGTDWLLFELFYSFFALYKCRLLEIDINEAEFSCSLKISEKEEIRPPFDRLWNPQVKIRFKNQFSIFKTYLHTVFAFNLENTSKR
jgi:hypothetical protein